MKSKLLLLFSFYSITLFSQTNLVTNGNLESWTNPTTLENWTIENNVSQNTTDVAVGLSSASFVLNDNNSQPLILAKVPLTSSVEYTVSFKFKYVSANYSGMHPITIKIIRTGSGTTVTSSSFATNNDWVERSLNFTPDQTGDYDLSIYLGSFDNQPFEVLIDDIKVFDPSQPSDTVNIPDANFKAELVNNFNINTNMDAEIQISEAAAFTGTISVINKNISDLTGIEAFTGLTQLICLLNNISALDISANTNLTFLNCASNNLTALDVSANTALTALSCNNNNITTLDVSANTGLTSLNCSYNSIGALDVSANTGLTYLNCSNNTIATLNVNTNTSLVNLYCGFNQLSSLNTANNPQLTKIWCQRNDITSLDISLNPLLVDLICNNNQLMALNVSNNTALEYFHFDYNTISNIDVTALSNLVSLRFFENSISSIDVSNNPELIYLDCGQNNISTIDVTSNINLKDLRIDTNNISNINLTNNTLLEKIQFQQTYFTTLDLSSNSSLTYILGSSNALTSLDLRNGNNANVTYFHILNADNLNCVFVDDKDYSNANWTNPNPGTTYFVETEAECNNLSVNDFVSGNLKIYPNPVYNEFIINASVPFLRVQILNLEGQLLLETNQSKIDVSNLSRGLYFVRIENENSMVITEKFIKK